MRWPPYRHVIFDCDSTLTAVEGIDVLAQRAGRMDEVVQLTEAAMNGELALEDVYGERLTAISPTRSEIAALRHDYKESALSDAGAVIATLAELGHEVYIVSGGLAEAVREFGISLGVGPSHIMAVGLSFDELAGSWWERDKGDERYLDYGRGALAMSAGKAQIIDELVGDAKGKRLMVGDGVSDLLAAEAVDLFVGYGGVASRPRVAAEAPVFLDSEPLSPILPLAAGPGAIARLTQPSQRSLFSLGTELALDSRWNDSRLREVFAAAADKVAT